jgi:hypothetical protein
MRVHTGEKPYTCDVCDHKSATSGQMANHMRVHTGEKPYTCDVCDARFSESGSVKTHMRVHTGEKPYTCDVCDARFTLSGGLVTHMRVHTGEKPHKCNVCDARFSESGSVKTHMRVHTGEKPYACTACDYKCALSSGLGIHMRVHTGKKPYVCDVCDARFTQLGALKKHTLVHTGERPVSCDICDNRFAVSGNMERHKELVHDIGKHRCDYCLGNRNSRNNHYDETLDKTVHVCRDCFRKATGFGSLSEKRWAEYADEHLGTEGLMATDEALASVGGCTKRRPDRLYGAPELVELHEHDGGQHGSYTCEEKRITEIYDEPAISGKVMVVFRFNPDGYKTAYGEVKLTVAERLAVYVALVKRVRAETRTADTPRIFVYYLFYSHANPLVVQKIKHAFVGSMGEARGDAE